MEVNFYRLTSHNIDNFLPKLLEKIYISGIRILVFCKDIDQMNHLNDKLWTYTTKFFLPHGTMHDNFLEKQPILLTTDLRFTNNSPNLLILLNKIEIDNISDLGIFDKISYIFEDQNNEEKQNARFMWKFFSNNFDKKQLRYWEYVDNQWENKFFD